MSSSERTPPARLARRSLLMLAAAGVGLLAAGCLRPLYGDVAATTPGGGTVRDALKAIEVAAIPDLVGHYLRNELVFDLDGSGQDSVKKFRLGVVVRDNTDVTVVNSVSGQADAATLILTADWTLTSLADGKVLHTGETFARVTYDRSTQRFATVRAARDARVRGAKVLSGLIRNRLAAALVTGV